MAMHATRDQLHLKISHTFVTMTTTQMDGSSKDETPVAKRAGYLPWPEDLQMISQYLDKKVVHISTLILKPVPKNIIQQYLIIIFHYFLGYIN